MVAEGRRTCTPQDVAFSILRTQYNTVPLALRPAIQGSKRHDASHTDGFKIHSLAFAFVNLEDAVPQYMSDDHLVGSHILCFSPVS